MSPPARSQIPTQSAELQDLQHQVSLRTSELRTLQREHDALLQKFERQKGKCAMMEKKLEFSDVEMDSLRDVKEKLSVQVSTMECQIEDLQQSRDEARRQLVANGAQYMQIMEMANRLQTQSTEAKRKWETEKAGLEQRIRVLEEAMVTGTERPIPTSDAEQQPGITPVSSPIGFAHNVSTSQAETISVLRTEVGRLRSRTQTLEAAMQTMRSESLDSRTANSRVKWQAKRYRTRCSR
jgi:chromosome segregation ATPase